MLFDTHAHYDDTRFDADRDALLASLPAQGVGLVLNPGCDLPSSRTAVALAERHAHVYAAVGVHPENCAAFGDADLAALRQLAAHPKVRAIGEIGLDYYWPDNPPRAFQQEVFRRQLELARTLDLPVVVHDREAHGDTLAIVKEFPGLRGVFHCYSGSAEMARELLRLGWYLGFDGPITYKNVRNALEVLREIPRDRVLIETDAPYLTPEPFRGKRNDSTLVRLVAEKLAELWDMDDSAVAELTARNGRAFFGL